MFEQLLANNAKSTLAVAVTTNSQAAIQVQSGAGALFPSVQPGDFFLVTLDDGTNVEICRCVAISGDVLTVLRGMEGTVAQSSFAVTVTRVEMRWTADTMRFYASRRLADTQWLRAAGNINSWHVMGVALPTIVGSPAAATLTNSSPREQNERIRLTLGHSAQFPVNFRVPQPVVSGQKGYRATFRFGFATIPNSSHFYVGLQSTTGLVQSVNPPTSLQNGIVVGWDNAGSLQGTFLNVYSANSGTTVNKVALSSYFNVNTQAWYEVELYQMEGRARIDYTVRRLDVSSIPDVTSYFTTNIPDNSLWLTPYAHGVSMVTSALAWELGGVWVYD